MAFQRFRDALGIAAACTILGLTGANASALTITGGSGTGTTVTGALTITSPINLTNDYLLYTGTDNTGSIEPAAVALPSASCSTPNCTAPIYYSYPNFVSSGYATVLGTYVNSDNTPQGIAIAVNSSTGTSGIGQSFSSVFNGASESTIMSDLETGDTTALLAFLTANQSDFVQYAGSGIPVTGTVLSFTNGANIGSFTVTPDVMASSAVPEPSSYLLLIAGAGALGFAMLRKRFSLSA